MKATFLTFGDRSLPSYLGYGILNENSVNFVNDVITAEYCLECDGSVVHVVRWSAQFCEIDTLLHGISCRMSHYPKLEYTLMADLQSNDFTKDRVFNYLVQTITKLGNIYVQFPGSGERGRRAVFFPAGLLMCFRLPVTAKTPAWHDFLDKVAATGYIGLHSEKKSMLFLCDAGYHISQETVTMVEFIVPMAYITSAARLFGESGIIDQRLPYRLMIVESLQAETSSMQVFTGNKNFPVFGFCYMDLPASHISALRQAFARSAEQIKSQIS